MKADKDASDDDEEDDGRLRTAFIGGGGLGNPGGGVFGGLAADSQVCSPYVRTSFWSGMRDMLKVWTSCGVQWLVFRLLGVGARGTPRCIV